MSSVKLPFTKSHAFVIGNDNYRNISPLQSAVKDARDIADLLGNVHGYAVHTLYDGTKVQMEKFFADMANVVHKDDRVIFYFAGHGIALDSENDPAGYLVPVDAEDKGRDKLVPMSLLSSTLHNLPCKHGLLVLDCCFAGSFKWSTGFRSIFFDDPYEELYEERFLRFVEHPAWQVITSSAHDQKALDLIKNDAIGLREQLSKDPASKAVNSPFAYALQQAINLEGKADVIRGKRGDGVITATELYMYIREIVEEESRRQGTKQSPAIFTLSKHDTKGEYVFIHPGHPLNLKKAPDRNPYRGLNAYGVKSEDAKTFFGRSRSIRIMEYKLKSSSLLVVSAPSGQGKSSTVRAGLFPALQKSMDYQPDQFHVLRPGDREPEKWEFLDTVDPKEKQVILIDQYEEMYTEAEELRQDFEQKLESLAGKIMQYSGDEDDEPAPTKLILTIRSDFEWQLKVSAFGQSFWKEEDTRSFMYRLPPMDLEELREATVKPARVVAYEFESEELVNRILEEVHNAPGALPLLSFTLHKLYELRDKNRRLLTEKAYVEELGGVNGALSKHADKIYKNLPDDMHRDFMRKLMLRMVRLNDGSYSRRRVYLSYQSSLLEKSLSELDYPDHLDATVESVLDTLEETQLVVRGKDSLGPYVEPMHDSLINYWPTCLQWIQEFRRENLVLQRQLWQAVVEHHQWKPDTYSEEGAEAPLWDNNPKLQQLQIAITDPKDEWLCKKGWGDKSISSIAWLLWQEELLTAEQSKDVLDYAWFFGDGYEEGRYTTNADPAEIFGKIRGQMDAWLNEAELDFVKRSFEKQKSEIERLKKQRDDAIRAKEEAEAARQRTVTEMIEASWKAGTLIQHPNDNWVRGSRDLYERLQILMSLKKARSLSPIPIFVKGPHGDDFDLDADSFGYYNPEFLAWARKNIIPAKNNAAFRVLTQPFYNAFMRDMARVYYLAYKYLQTHTDLRDRVKKEYFSYSENKANFQTEDMYGGGGFFLQSRLRGYPDAHEAELVSILGEMSFYYWVVAAGFWIRRLIDTTAEAFFKILTDLLETYDKDWVSDPPVLPK